MTRKTWTLIAAVVVLVVVGLLIITSQTRPGGVTKVGAVLPLTGSAAVWGQNAKMGIDLAVDEINAAGGVNGDRLEVLYEDSQSEPKVATSALQKMISTQNVHVVVGDIASSSVLAMAPIAERSKVVLLSPGASNPEITNAGKFIFRNWQSDALEGEVDAAFAYNTLGWKKVATLYVNNAYGAGLEKVFVESFTKLGGNVLTREAFAQGATDMRAQIAKVAAAKPDGIYMPGYPPEMALTLKQMRESGVSLPALSVQAFDDPEILKRAGSAAEGVVFSVPKPPDTADPVVSEFQRKYKERYGKDPGVCSDTGYDAIRIIASVMKQGAKTGDEIRRKLETVKDFPGAAGRTTFDANGDVIRDFVLKTVRNGRFEPL
jgi:branched-chain amino acid transport system substrate-binding protein